MNKENNKSILNEICERKAEHVKSKKAGIPLHELEAHAAAATKPRGFINALKTTNGAALIAEVKKASPSKGVIRKDFDPAQIAKIYENNHASCLSVLTDEPYFQGHDNYLTAVKNTVSIPVLRKDFMIDPYQIIESRALGADCILLIMAALTDTQAKELYDLAKSLDMDVLTEVHNEEELERAIVFTPEMIGINNRNLKTLDVDIQISHDLLPKIPAETIKVAESGLSDASTIQSLHNKNDEENGYDSFLIGESLMRHENIAEKIKLLFPEKFV